jgi:cytochrome c peroxidase
VNMSLNGKRILVLSCLIVTAFFLSAITPHKPASLTTGLVQTDKPLTPIEELGRRLFFEETLSTPPGQSCATCHDPAAAFAQPVKDIPVSRGAHADRFGSRNDLPAAYAAFVPPLHKDPEEEIWVGGLFWDGRANTLAEQAMMPPLNPLEMAGRNAEDIAGKLRVLDYAKLFTEVFGPEALNDADQAFKFFGLALEAFQKTKQFNPFDSKYDAYLRGETTLTDQEMRGLALFEAEDKGNCSACHPSRPEEDGKPPLFTDFTYDNLGVPKNPENPFYLMPKEHNPQGFNFVDLGLAVTVGDEGEKGKFRVPTLRNVALTGPYTHNGFFKTLFSVVAFYNTRDLAPWPAPEVKENVNTEEMGNLKLSNQEVEDIVVFMLTLTDGWKKPR